MGFLFSSTHYNIIKFVRFIYERIKTTPELLLASECWLKNPDTIQFPLKFCMKTTKISKENPSFTKKLTSSQVQFSDFTGKIWSNLAILNLLFLQNIWMFLTLNIEHWICPFDLGDVAKVNQVLRNGAYINQKDDFWESTVLHKVAQGTVKQFLNWQLKTSNFCKKKSTLWHRLRQICWFINQKWSRCR